MRRSNWIIYPYVTQILPHTTINIGLTMLETGDYLVECCKLLQL